MTEKSIGNAHEAAGRVAVVWHYLVIFFLVFRIICECHAILQTNCNEWKALIHLMRNVKAYSRCCSCLTYIPTHELHVSNTAFCEFVICVFLLLSLFIEIIVRSNFRHEIQSFKLMGAHQKRQINVTQIKSLLLCNSKYLMFVQTTYIFRPSHFEFLWAFPMNSTVPAFKC